MSLSVQETLEHSADHEAPVMFDPSLLLSTDSARAIFAEIESLPVFDIHTHVNLPAVLANDPAPDPWTALCSGDHYVSAIIESPGAMNRQQLFSSETAPYEKWAAYAAVFPDLLGNQIRDWMKMTLQALGVAALQPRERPRHLGPVVHNPAHGCLAAGQLVQELQHRPDGDHR